jgi:cytochrome P450
VAESGPFAGADGSGRLAWREIPRAGWRESLAQVRHMRRDMLGVVSERFARHGPVVRQSQGPMRMVSLAGPDAARMLLLDRENLFSAKRSWDLIMGRIFPNGLLLRDGDDHRHHRALLREAFRTPALERYLADMNSILEEQLAGLDDGGPLRAFDRMKSMTLAIACRIFLGMPPEEDTTRLNRAFEAAVAASMSIVRLPLPGLEFERGLRGRRVMVRRLSALIAERRGGSGGDLLSQLCGAQGEDGRPLSDGEIVDHMIFLMMAAHDTTTSTLTSLLYELAAHPDWQERVRDEVRGLGKPAIEFADLLELPQLICVLQETLRRYPPLSTIPRVCTRSFEWAGCEIPADVMVVIYPIHTHHMPEWWSEPFRFDPERFSREREEHKRHSHSYFPFGGGNHMCLGLRFAELQIKAVLFQLLQRYRFRVPEGYRMPVQQAPISKPLDGLPLWFERIA